MRSKPEKIDVVLSISNAAWIELPFSQSTSINAIVRVVGSSNCPGSLSKRCLADENTCLPPFGVKYVPRTALRFDPRFRLLSGRAMCYSFRAWACQRAARELVSDSRLDSDRALTKGARHDMLAQRDCSRCDSGGRRDLAHGRRGSRRARRLRRPDLVRTIGGLRRARGGVGSRHARRYSRVLQR